MNSLYNTAAAQEQSRLLARPQHIYVLTANEDICVLLDIFTLRYLCALRYLWQLANGMLNVCVLLDIFTSCISSRTLKD
jgi:hypothetical protein